MSENWLIYVDTADLCSGVVKREFGVDDELWLCIGREMRRACWLAVVKEWKRGQTRSNSNVYVMDGQKMRMHFWSMKRTLRAALVVGEGIKDQTDLICLFRYRLSELIKKLWIREFVVIHISRKTACEWGACDCERRIRGSQVWCPFISWMRAACECANWKWIWYWWIEVNIRWCWTDSSP